MRLHWNQIVDLRKYAGKLDIDSGKLFVRFQGRTLGSDFYEGEPVLSEPNAFAKYDIFSLSRVVAGLSPLEAIEVDEDDEIEDESIELSNEDLTNHDSDSGTFGPTENEAGGDGGEHREVDDR